MMSHSADVRQIYNTVTSSRISPAVRSKKVWDWLFDAGSHTWLFRKPMLIIDGNGIVCGYLTGAHDSTARFGEIVVKQSESAYRAALGAITRYAKRLESQEIVFPLPWDDAFAVYLRQRLRLETVFQSGATGGALMKIVDFPALIKRLEPLFQARWFAGTNLACTAKIVSDIGNVELRMDTHGLVAETDVPGSTAVKSQRPTQSPAKAAKIPSRWLSGLLTGYYSIHDILPREDVSIPRDLVDPLSLLFPTGWPFIFQGDNY